MWWRRPSSLGSGRPSPLTRLPVPFVGGAAGALRQPEELPGKAGHLCRSVPAAGAQSHHGTQQAWVPSPRHLLQALRGSGLRACTSLGGWDLDQATSTPSWREGKGRRGEDGGLLGVASSRSLAQFHLLALRKQHF